MLMTVQFEGGLRWPKHEPDMFEQMFGPEDAERMRARRNELLGDSHDAGLSEEERVAELITSWRDDYPKLTHPGDWRPSRRRVQEDLVSRLIDTDEGRHFYLGLLGYKSWLSRHMIIEPGPANMIRDVLMHSERDGNRNLRYIAFERVNWLIDAHNFEQEYLGLSPLPVETEDEFGPIPSLEDDGLHIREDGLYGPYDFQFGGERGGGELPIEPVAKKLLTTPDELNRRLQTEGIDEREDSYYYVNPFNMIVLDKYLLMARSHPTDPMLLLCGPVRELSPFGTYLLEQLLRTYEYGMAAR